MVTRVHRWMGGFDADVTGSIQVHGSENRISIGGASMPTANLHVWGTGMITGDTSIGGDLSVDSTTDSTSGTTGSIHTDGGLGVAKDVFVGSQLGVQKIGTNNPFTVYHDDTSVAGTILIEQDGTGDPSLHFLITGLLDWSVGVDNSDDDNFKIARSSDLGTSTALSIDSSLAVTLPGILSVDDTTDSTSGTTGSIHTDGGLGVVKDVFIGGDFAMTTDGSTLSFGSDGEIVLTHVHNSGLRFSDNDKLLFGAGDDLQIYHSGSHSYIDDISGPGTGRLKIQTNRLDIEGTGETMATFTDDGAVDLYYNNNKKFETTATGVTLKNAGDTDDDSPVILTLQTAETVITVDDVLGKIVFQAPDEASGSNSTVVLASIQAHAETLFDGNNNHTSLNFMTSGTNTADEEAGVNVVSNRMKITGNGNVLIGTTSFGIGSNVAIAGGLDVVSGKIRESSNVLLPAGMIVMSGNTTVNTGWLQCDGIAISRTEYSDLFSSVGTSFGVGNGNNTFNIPDFSDRFPLGKGTNNSTLGTQTGATSASSALATGSGTTGGGTTGTSNTGTGTTGTGTTGTATTGTSTSGSTGGSTVASNTGTGTTGTGTSGTGTTGTATTGTATSGSTSISAHSLTTVTVAASAKDSSTTSVVSAVATHSAHTHSVPGLSVPGLSVPGLSIPGLSIPALTIPSLTVNGHTHSVPGLSVPGLSVPGLTVPALTVPGLSVPGLSVPALSLTVPSVVVNFLIKI